MATQTLYSLLSTGIYDIDIINNIKSKNFSALKKLSNNELSSATYMYPLLWAVKNELGTFEVYSYMSEDLQSDPDITTEILKVQPELFVGSPLSKDRRFILANITKMPQISLYMSETLKSDAGFVMELCSATSPEIAKQILENTGYEDTHEHTSSMDITPNSEDIVDDITVASIIATPTNLTLEQKNNHDLINAAAKQSDEFFDFVVNHAEDFGFHGLQGAIDAGKDKLETVFDKELTDKPSIIKNKEDLLELPYDDPTRMQTLAAIALLDGSITPELAKRILDYSKMQLAKGKTEEGKSILSHDLDEQKTFITPEVLQKCIEVLEEHNRTSPEAEKIAYDTDFLQEYSSFTSETIEPHHDPWEEEDAYYNEQYDRLEAEAAALGIPPEEYAKTHPVPRYEKYLAAQEGQKGNTQVSLEDTKEATESIKSTEVDSMTSFIKTDIRSKKNLEQTNDEIEVRT